MKNETLPGQLFDQLFTASNLAAIETALHVAEEAYRKGNGKDEDFDPEVRSAIVDACLKFQVLKDRCGL